MAERSLREIIESLLSHDEQAIPEFIARQPAPEVPGFIGAARLLGERAMHALTVDPGAFMRFKCPEVYPAIDKGLFIGGIEAAGRLARGSVPSAEVDDLLSPLSLEQCFALSSLCSRIVFVWEQANRHPARIAPQAE